jgi:acyl carrier protein
MIPAAFIGLDRMPLTDTGKLDRKALPRRDVAAADDTYIAPRTTTEETIASIWAEILGRERVSVEDNFFELGGHSLLAIQMISRVRDRLAAAVPIGLVFEAPTVAALARSIDQGNTAPVCEDGPVGSVPDISDLDDVVMMLEGLSDAEAACLLARQSAQIEPAN